MKSENPGADRSDSFLWFDLPSTELISRIGLVRESELDALPFAAICLDREGHVLCCNAAARGLWEHSNVIGRNIGELEPWRESREFRSRFQRVVLRLAPDQHVFTTLRFHEQERAFRIRMTSDPDTGLIWLLSEQRGRISSSDHCSSERQADLPERRAS